MPVGKVELEILFGLLHRLTLVPDVLLTYRQVQLWPEGMFDLLIRTGWLVPASNATGLLCDGCSNGCWIEPQRLPGKDGKLRLIYLCRQRDDIGMLNFDSDELLRWHLSPDGITAWLQAEVDGWGRAHRQGATWVISFRVGGARRGSHEVVTRPLDDLLIWEEAGPMLDLTNLPRGCGAPRSRRKGRVIPLPADATWEKLIIRLLDDEHAEVQYGDKRRRCSFADLGMSDNRRSPPEPASSWTMLRLIARSDGSLTWRDRGASDLARAHMKLLRQALRGAFGIMDDPFLPYEPKLGWRARFVLVDNRSQ